MIAIMRQKGKRSRVQLTRREKGRGIAIVLAVVVFMAVVRWWFAGHQIVE